VQAVGHLGMRSVGVYNYRSHMTVGALPFNMSDVLVYTRHTIVSFLNNQIETELLSTYTAPNCDKLNLISKETEFVKF